MMDQEQMRDRTRAFALRVVRMVSSLPAGRIGDVLGRQVLKAGTSIGANYREALRASTRRQFITTLEVSQREAEETLYWLDLLADSGLVKPSRLQPLTAEGHELLAILTATILTSKRRS